ncbi:MAG: ribose-phosphate diphosphokinase [archaeon]
MEDYKKGPVIFALSSTKLFGKKLGTNGLLVEETFPDGEPYVKPNQDIRGCDVFVVQSLHNYGSNGESLGDKLLKLIIFCNAAYHASAQRITAVIPHLGLSRQDRKAGSRDPLSAQALAMVLESCFVNRLLTMDPHNLAIQSGYRIRSDMLKPFRPWIDYLHPYFMKEKKVGLIAPDNNAKKDRVDPLEERVLTYYEGKPPFRLITGFIPKQRKSGKSIKSGRAVVYGDIRDSLVVIPDDESSTGGTMINAARKVKDRGTRYVIGTVVHNKLSKEAAHAIQEEKSIDEFWVMDTICRPELIKKYPKFKEISVASYFRKAIENIHEEKSLSAELF